ncbi:MAG: ECF transporter S component [Clostridiales bacterium]|jgi:riboflavin transporter FmnP|nr:ECF transporter S component [Clostridiales bacterium]
MPDRSSRLNIRKITLVAVMSALAFVLTLWKIPLPFFPSFLDFEMSEVPELIAALFAGTGAGILTLLVKCLLMTFKSTSGLVGELANFVVGCAFIIPFGLIHSKTGTLRRAAAGAVAGTVSMTAVACVFNYFVLIPAFVAIMNIPLDAIIAMTRETNALVSDLPSLVVFAIAPFNALKAAVFSAAALGVWRGVSAGIERYRK